MNSKAKGIWAEDLICSYLEKQGFEILERNYRYSHSEIDVIVLEENTLLVFVEVKMRSREDFGTAESFVSEHQEEKIGEAAEEYIYGINWKGDIRFDIITVDQALMIRHFRDVFS